MVLKTLDSFNFKGKRVLLRIDINSEISNGKVILSDRIIEHAKTIKELQKKKAKVTILAHQARPGKRDFTSLKKHARLLKVKFVPDILGKKAVKAITKLKPGQAILLENIRSLKEEFSPSTKNDIVKILAPLHDIYINDAFSILHRNQTSITSFPQVLPSAIGPVLENELASLKKITKMKNCLFILGGAKPEGNIPLIRGRKNILVCGLFGQLCLTAGGYNLGAQNKILKKEKKYLNALKKIRTNCTRPLDLAVSAGGNRKELNIEDFPSKYYVYDIGGKTQKVFIESIKKAKCIFMKGPAGYCEEKQFCKGTFALLRAIASSKTYSVIAGGHLITALKKSGISKNKFGYVSLSGGALEKYIAGEKLPGLEALKRGR